MKKINYKKVLPHVVAIVSFMVITFAYFSPVLEGKKLDRHDINVWSASAQEALNFKNETGEKTLWTNSMFGGMPTYLINSERNVFLGKLHKTLKVFKYEPVAQVYLYMVGAYLAFLLFGFSPWLAVLGAIAYAFSSYFFIIIQAGHATKAFALGYLPLIIAGVYYSFTKRALVGAVITAIALALQVNANHFQITYYTGLIVLVFGIVWFVKAVKEKDIKGFIKPALFNLAGVVLAIGINITSLYLTYEYGQFSMRGPSELSHNKDNKTSGLDKDYATAWSYGIGETFTFLVPNFKGGSSSGSLDEGSDTYKLFEQAQGKAYAKKVVKQLPLYFGTQPGTSGPVYVGALICFLFVLGLIIIKGPLKWWIVATTILAVLLGWGKNFMPFTDLFLDYFPGYNKFRAVSTIMVIAEFTFPLMAIFALREAFSGNVNKKEFQKAMIISFGITGGLTLVFAVFAGMFSYVAPSDAQMQEVLVEALQADRQSMLQADAFRSFLFIAIGAALLWFGYNDKLNKKLMYPLLIVLVLIDMASVNKRYLGNDKFVSQKTMKQNVAPSKSDEIILKDKDPDFRVLNLTVSTFNDATTSYYHKSIGGYHGAKMRRYQELIEFYISGEIQQVIKRLQTKGTSQYDVMVGMNVLNMLNTKYLIINPESFPIINTQAFGAAWLVESVAQVETADEEIQMLGQINPKNQAVVNKRFAALLSQNNYSVDAQSQISLMDYKPNHLTYNFKSNTKQLALFSEIYYPKGWDAYIDGEKVDYLSANYVLRALEIPEGEHKVEWKFHPKSYEVSSIIALICNIILFSIALLLMVKWFLARKEN